MLAPRGGSDRIPATLPAYNYEWNAAPEVNGQYTADGSNEVFLSPTLQFVTERWALEASPQLLVVQDLDSDEPETDYRLVVGVRFQWRALGQSEKEQEEAGRGFAVLWTGECLLALR